jgi:hypothetical protein
MSEENKPGWCPQEAKPMTEAIDSLCREHRLGYSIGSPESEENAA